METMDRVEPAAERFDTETLILRKRSLWLGWLDGGRGPGRLERRGR